MTLHPEVLTGVLAASFVVSLLLCALLVRLGRAGLMLDQPNARSLHAVPTPRTGGLAIAAGMLPVMLTVFWFADADLRAVIAGWTLVFGVSLLDDLRDLRASVRLAVHVAAGFLVLSTFEPLDWFTAGLGMFWIVWGTNLFNFMDGMDGLAGSMALIGGLALSLALMLAGAGNAAVLLGSAVAATAGFLVFNRPPAKLFMGDAGSAPLGFLFAATAVDGVHDGRLPGWLPLLVFLPFIADATFTLLRRGVQGKAVWQAHREHAYQVLVLAGWPVWRVLAVFALFMLLCGGAALMLFVAGHGGWFPFSLAVLITLALYWGIMDAPKQRESRDKKDRGDRV